LAQVSDYPNPTIIQFDDLPNLERGECVSHSV
jgi:hypothetical protein